MAYLRLREQFCYLAVILDVWSRRVVGWALSHDLTAKLALDALRVALAARRPQPGWIHHSDRGVQYACSEYVALLERHEAHVSMSRPGNPYDNAFCESFIGKLKQEQWDGRGYRDLIAVRQDLRRPVLLTSRGRGVAVVQSVSDYETAEEERSFMRAVVAGLADLESGREVSLVDAKARLGLE